MKEKIQLRLTPEQSVRPEKLIPAVAAALHVDPERVTYIQITRRSIDARRRPVTVNLIANVFLDSYTPEDTRRYEPRVYRDVSDAPRVVIVGAGPAGLFAALELLELGLKPIVLERGRDVDTRRRDQAELCRTGVVDPDSNYCFGEGGAGAFSDGKLYTRSTKRGPVDKVLQTFHAHGADDSVLVNVHPHIGTDRLPDIIKAMRHTILDHGGEVHFGTRVTSLIVRDGEVKGVRTADGSEYLGPVILATGHSARDVYAFLQEAGADLEAKGIAVGVRLEHPQHLIDCIQYHSREGRGKFLPPAEYSMLTRVDGRAVYSFCMCPGGVIVPAASAPGGMVVNGMSPSTRGTRWANSGMVVEVLPEDLEALGYDTRDAMCMLRFQQDIERKFYEAAGRTLVAPAQRMTDFVAGRPSRDLPRSSYAPGLQPAMMNELLPAPVADRLRRGLEEFGRKARGFMTHEAVLIGDETRTSAPLRVPRDRDTMQHTVLPGLYPCGEGAGYAGGIVSAAIDGINCARALAGKFPGHL